MFNKPLTPHLPICVSDFEELPTVFAVVCSQVMIRNSLATGISMVVWTVRAEPSLCLLSKKQASQLRPAATMARVAEALSSYLQCEVEAARAAQSRNSSSSRRQCVERKEAIYSRARAAIN